MIFQISRSKPCCPIHGDRLVFTDGIYGGYYACPTQPCEITANKRKGEKRFYLTDQETRNARKRAHAAFDVLWKSGGMDRGSAYRWLAQKMNLSPEHCHMQMFDGEQCEQVVKHCAESFARVPAMAIGGAA